LTEFCNTLSISAEGFRKLIAADAPKQVGNVTNLLAVQGKLALPHLILCPMVADEFAQIIIMTVWFEPESGL
jgi:hypothetical protein